MTETGLRCRLEAKTHPSHSRQPGITQQTTASHWKHVHRSWHSQICAPDRKHREKYGCCIGDKEPNIISAPCMMFTYFNKGNGCMFYSKAHAKLPGKNNKLSAKDLQEPAWKNYHKQDCWKELKSECFHPHKTFIFNPSCFSHSILQP